VVVGLAVLALALASLYRLRQLGDAWNPDEWYLLGANLAVRGTLGHGDEPTVFRPPGYPALVAAVLCARGCPAQLTPTVAWGTRPGLYLVQTLALALGAGAAAFSWSARMSPAVAAAGAVALGANPYVFALVGLPHYALVHLVLLVLGTWALAAALASRRWLPLAACGVFWGLVTLVRPVTLPLPLFVLLLLGISGEAWAVALRRSAVFAAGLVLAVAPWTLRNFEVRGRFVAVNAQAWTVLWAATVKAMPVRPDHFNWYSVARGEYLDVFRRVTGAPGYEYRALYSHDVALEDAFRVEAVGNLRRQPGTYVGNVGRAAGALLFATSSLPVRLLGALQRPGARLEDAWFEPGHPQDFHRSVVARAYAALATMLLPVAALGLVAGTRRRDPFLLAPAMVGSCVALAHSLTYMDLFYYYVRLPFLFLLAAYGFETLRERAVAAGRHGGTPVALATGVGLAFAVLSLALVLGAP
jgi:hypothetical protein